MTVTQEIVYDGECLFCTRCVRVLEAWDRAGRLRKVPFQQPGFFESHPGLDRETVMEAMQYYDGAGRRWSGAEAFREAARVLPLGGPLAFVLGLPGARWAADRLYRWIARNRRSLGCRSAACELGRRSASPFER